jgi:hypothetical protein
MSYSSKRDLSHEDKSSNTELEFWACAMICMMLFIHWMPNQDQTCKQDEKMKVASILLEMEKYRLCAAWCNFFPYDHFYTKMHDFLDGKH